MSNYKLTKLKNTNTAQLAYDTTQIEYDFEGSTLDHMLEAYSDFLKGCGFSFDGTLEIVESDDEFLKLPETNGDEA